MDAVLLVVRFALAAVFAIAAVSKLLDPHGSRRAVRDFGVPARLAAPLGVALPLAELAVAAMLVPAGTAVWGACAAGGVLAVFGGAIAANLLRGRRPDCHCFGQLHSSPAGPGTLLRNVALAALAAAAAAFGPGPSGVAWLGRLEAAEAAALALGVALAVVVGLAVWAFVHLLRQHGRLFLRLDALEEQLAAAGIAAIELAQPGLVLGSEAPEFDRLRPANASALPAVLVFGDAGCAACRELAPAIERWRREHADRLAVVSVEDPELAEAYQVAATPSAVFVDAGGRVASGIAEGAAAIEELVESAAAGEFLGGELEAGLSVGAPAPDVRLPSLAGGEVTLADFRGRETLVLFWNPGCGFCQAMLDDLRSWEDDPPDRAPALLVLSSGSADETRRDGFRSTAALDEDFAVAGAFGASGTPMAVLIDSEGRIASSLAAGAEAVLALAGARQRVGA